jgi:hypothetical protein
MIAIVKPEGDGEITAADPRYYSKDQGSSTADHDIMLGQANNFGRARVRFTGGTITIINNTQTMQANSLNLIALTTEDNDAEVHHIREDGGYESTTGSGTGTYTPRTTTTQALLASAEFNGNPYDGELIGVWAFRELFTESMLREFFYSDPWQVLEEPEIMYSIAAAAPQPSPSGRRRIIIVT